MTVVNFSDYNEAIKRKAGTTTEPPPEIEIHNAGHDPEPSEIEPREWLMARSSVANSSRTDWRRRCRKSSLRILQLISLATGRALTGHPVFFRCKVLIVSLEDSRKELQRRIAERESTMEFQRKN